MSAQELPKWLNRLNINHVIQIQSNYRCCTTKSFTWITATVIDIKFNKSDVPYTAKIHFNGYENHFQDRWISIWRLYRNNHLKKLQPYSSVDEECETLRDAISQALKHNQFMDSHVINIITEYAMGVIMSCCNTLSACMNKINFDTRLECVLNKYSQHTQIYEYTPIGNVANRIMLSSNQTRIFCENCTKNELIKCSFTHMHCAMKELPNQRYHQFMDKDNDCNLTFCYMHRECIECRSILTERDSLKCTRCKQYYCTECVEYYGWWYTVGIKLEWRDNPFWDIKKKSDMQRRVGYVNKICSKCYVVYDKTRTTHPQRWANVPWCGGYVPEIHFRKKGKLIMDDTVKTQTNSNFEMNTELFDINYKSRGDFCRKSSRKYEYKYGYGAKYKKTTWKWYKAKNNKKRQSQWKRWNDRKSNVKSGRKLSRKDLLSLQY